MSIAGAGGTYIYSQTLSAGQPSFLSQSIIIFNPSFSAYITTSGVSLGPSNFNAGGNSGNNANPNSNAGGNSGNNFGRPTASTTINYGKIAEVKIATRHGTHCSLFVPPTTNLIVDLEVQSIISYDGCYVTFLQ